MSDTIDRFDDMVAVEKFLEYVRGGEGELNAGIAVGWTPRQVRKYLKDDEFAALVREQKDRRIESIEKVVFDKALEGTRWAVEMALFCQAADRGWRPPTTKIDVTRTHKVEGQVVVSVVEGLRQAMASGGDLAALQPGGPLGEIVDAEVVEPDADN